jgi:hypothetical protein
MHTAPFGPNMVTVDRFADESEAPVRDAVCIALFDSVVVTVAAVGYVRQVALELDPEPDPVPRSAAAGGDGPEGLPVLERPQCRTTPRKRGLKGTRHDGQRASGLRTFLERGDHVHGEKRSPRRRKAEPRGARPCCPR